MKPHGGGNKDSKWGPAEGVAWGSVECLRGNMDGE